MPRFLQPDEPWVIPWLRDRLLTNYTRMQTKFPRRVYISRNKAASRRVVNEPELLDLLQACGFVSLHLEELSWFDQVSLFWQAEAIAGPHGAGFANLIFCSPGAFIMELMPEGYPSQLYEQLSLRQKLKYRRINATPLRPNQPANSDMEVDLKSARELLKLL